MRTLTPTQEKFREAITELLHPYARGAGRTELMATVWVDIAKNFPGDWIEVFDHRPRPHNRRAILDRILDIEPAMVVNYSTYSIKWEGNPVYIKFEGWGVRS